MTAGSSGPVLVAYDGSENADRAVALAAALFPDRLTLVVTVWQPASVALASHSYGAPLLGDLVQLDREVEKAAAETAAKGEQRAIATGATAEGVTVQSTGPIWQAIIETADARDAEVIVVGRRGLSGLRSLLLGSVSNPVVQHSERPVLIAPPES